MEPNIILVLGGSEISYETETQPLYPIADYIICGEAEFLFKNFCDQIIAGLKIPNTIPYRFFITHKVIPGKSTRLRLH